MKYYFYQGNMIVAKFLRIYLPPHMYLKLTFFYEFANQILLMDLHMFQYFYVYMFLEGGREGCHASTKKVVSVSIYIFLKK